MDDTAAVNRYAAPPMLRVLFMLPDKTDLESDALVKAVQGATSIRTTTLTLKTGYLSIARRIRYYREVSRQHDVVHAIGFEQLAAALTVSLPLVYSPIGFPTRRQIAWLRAVTAYRSIMIVATSDTLRRALVTRGIDYSKTRLIRPGVAMSLVSTARDRALRERLGIADEELALFAPLAVTRDSGHTLAMWATSLLHVLDGRYKLIIRQEGVSKLDDARKRLIDPKILIDANERTPEASFGQIFSACDCVLLTPVRPVSPWVVTAAMSSGRPVVATTTPQLCELLEDRHTAMLVGEPTPRRVAQRVLDTLNDPPRARTIADRARAEVYDRLTQRRMLAEYLDVYDNVVVSSPVTSAGAADRPTHSCA